MIENCKFRQRFFARRSALLKSGMAPSQFPRLALGCSYYLSVNEVDRIVQTEPSEGDNPLCFQEL